MNIFGIQTQFDSAEAPRYSREVLPTTVMGINVVKAKWWREIRDGNPDGWRVHRHHPDPRFDDYATPEESAEKAVAALEAEIGHLLTEGLITHVTDGNEDIEAKHLDLHPLRDRYAAAFIELARQELGVGTFWGNFFCGHFSDETVDLFPLALQAMEEDNQAHPDNPSAIAFHEYDWPTLDRIFAESGDYWLCGKFLKAMPPILEKYPNAKCAITEFGIDSGVAVEGEHQGWRKTHEDLSVAIEMLCEERGLEWYYPLTRMPWLIAVLWFGCGMGGDWRGRGFDIMENEDDTTVMGRVKQFAGWTPPPSPEPQKPEEEPMDEIKVVDLEYKERDLAYVEAKYGVAFRRAEVEPGQKVYRLVELWEKTGNSSLVTQVLNEDGSPMADVDVAFYWTDAPQQAGAYAHDWHKNFMHGKTNKDGDVGPGMGKGAYHGKGEGGPHAVWVRDPNIPSDICEKLGMLAGTFHDHLDQKFKLMVQQEGEPPPPMPGSEAQFVEVAGGRAFQPQGDNRIVIVAQGERDFYDTRVWIGVMGSDWEAGPFQPEESITKYTLTADYTPGEGEQSRTFWVRINHPNGTLLGGPFEFEFRTGEHGWWTTLVEWRETTPEPPPTGDSAVARLARAIAAALTEFAIEVDG